MVGSESGDLVARGLRAIKDFAAAGKIVAEPDIFGACIGTDKFAC